MSQVNSLITGEEEQVEVRPRAPLEEDSGSDWELAHGKFSATKKAGSAETLEGEIEDDAVYCICRKVESGFMVGCEGGCDDWFHGKCVNIKDYQKDMLKTFVCPACTSSGRGVSTWDSDAEETDEDFEEDVPLCPLDPQPARIVAPAQNRIGRPKLRTLKPVKPEAWPVVIQPLSFLFGTSDRNRALRMKVRYSGPGFENVKPGSRGPLPDDEDAEGDHGYNGDDDGQDGASARKRRAIIPFSNKVDSIRHDKVKKRVMRPRSYLDVQEHHSVVDAIVKNSLEQSLFGH